MRKSVGLKAALFGGSAACLLLSAASLHAQIVNPSWELPTNTVGGTDTNATGWTMTASGEVGQAGNRDTFYNNTPGGSWSYWLQDFEASGSATQSIPGIVAGTGYTFTSQMLFELGSGSTQGVTDGYDNIPGETSFLEMQFENSLGQPLGIADQNNIPSGSVTLNRTWAPYSVSGVAPAGATRVVLEIGWVGGAGDGGTGSQSAFADDEVLSTSPVPEPATLSVLGLGAVGLMVRRRRTARTTA